MLCPHLTIGLTLGAILFSPLHKGFAQSVPEAPILYSISHNDREITAFDILLHRKEIQRQLGRHRDPEIEKQIPQLTLEASQQSLLHYSVFPEISRLSRLGQANFDAYQAEIEFPPDLQTRAWPYLQDKETSFLVTWYDPENESPFSQATLVYRHLDSSWRTISELYVPATNLPAGTKKPRGFPLVLALKDGQFVPPSDLSQRYRFTPAPPNATDSQSISLGLHFAAQNGFTSYFKTYIESFPKGKSPVTKRLRDQYAYMAAQFGRPETLQYFISIGTNPQKPVPDRYTTTVTRFVGGYIQEQTVNRPTATNLIFETLEKGQSGCAFAILESLQHEPRKLIHNSVVAKAMEHREFELAKTLLELGYPYKPVTKAQRELDRSNASIFGYPELVDTINSKFVSQLN